MFVVLFTQRNLADRHPITSRRAHADCNAERDVDITDRECGLGGAGVECVGWTSCYLRVGIVHWVPDRGLDAWGGRRQRRNIEGRCALNSVACCSEIRGPRNRGRCSAHRPGYQALAHRSAHCMRHCTRGLRNSYLAGGLRLVGMPCRCIFVVRDTINVLFNLSRLLRLLARGRDPRVLRGILIC